MRTVKTLATAATIAAAGFIATTMDVLANGGFHF